MIAECDGSSRPAPSPSSSPTSKGRRGSCTSWPGGLRRGPLRAPSADPRSLHDRGGVEVDTQGDAFFFAFSTASGALAAARAFTEALSSGRIQVRVGLHTGTPLVTDEGYVGDDVHFAARVASSGHGGQVILSRPRPNWWRPTSSTLASTGSRTSPSPSRSFSSARALPAAEDDLEHEPAATDEFLRGPRARGNEVLARIAVVLAWSR